MPQPKQDTSRKSAKPGDGAAAKQKQLEVHSQGNENLLTTNQGAVIPDNHNSLKAGVRGPTLLEDFILREKITHFDHERIPERVVHARGTAAHGYFEALTFSKKFAGPKSNSWLPGTARSNGTRLVRSMVFWPLSKPDSSDGDSISPSNR